MDLSLPTRASQIDSIHAAANIRNPMVPAGVPGQVSSSELISVGQTEHWMALGSTLDQVTWPAATFKVVGARR
jgi:hypothetical protein